MNVAQNFNPLHVKIHAGDDCNLFGCHEQKYPTQNFFQLLPRFPLTCAKNPVYYYCCAGVAQLVEQLIRNQQVAGSSPATSSKNTPMVRCWIESSGHFFAGLADRTFRRPGVNFFVFLFFR